MNESDKAVMQQALRALERVYCVDGDCDILLLSLCEAVEESIAALRVAIAQPVPPATLEPLTAAQLLVILQEIDHDTKRLPPGFIKFARAIEAAHNVALPVQEPAIRQGGAA